MLPNKSKYLLNGNKYIQLSIWMEELGSILAEEITPKLDNLRAAAVPRFEKGAC